MSARYTKYKYLQALHNGEFVPRKAKKYFLGIRMSKSELNRLLKSVSLVLYKNEERPSYPVITFKPYAFCPKCGCTQYRGYYRAGYFPEVYNSYYCLRCGKLVAWEDNSPFTHILEEYLWDEFEKQMETPEKLPVYKFDVEDIELPFI